MRTKSREKCAYLDGDWGDETLLTAQFLIRPGESLSVLKEENDFYLCEWNDFRGWLRTSSVSFLDPTEVQKKAATDAARSIEKIVDVRKRGRGHQYLVRWERATEEEDTWEPPKKLAKSEVFAAYLAAHPPDQ
jgi:hypothetical protein